MSPCSVLAPPSPAGWGDVPVCLWLADPGVSQVQPQPWANCHPKDHFFFPMGNGGVVVLLPQGGGSTGSKGTGKGWLSHCCFCSAATTEGGAEHTPLLRFTLTGRP